MQLYSLQFVAFLCLSLAAYFALGRIAPRYQWTVLLAASLGFYVCTGWHNLFFILLTAGSSWAVGMAFGKLEERSKAARKATSDRAQKKAIKARFNHYKWLVLLAALVLNFGVLSYIKYWNVLLDGLGMGESFLASSLLLPLGLSFYTFQSMGYLIDAYNGKIAPERNPLKYLLFVSWFPQLIQGPINRFDQLAEQLCAPRRFDGAGAKRALLLIGFGMLKKFVIADMLVKTIAACLDQVTPGTPGSIIVFGILLYSAQQYGDFSGGIDMVRGVSQLFGVRMAPRSKLVEGDSLVIESLNLDQNELDAIEHIVKQMEEESGLDRMAALADMRFTFIEHICLACVIKPHESIEHKRSVAIDRVLTGRYTAIPMFLLIMGLVFWLTFGVIGAGLQGVLGDAIDACIDMTAGALEAFGTNPVVRSLIVDGVMTGVGSVLSFLPIIVVLFLLLSILEDSGYMARVAFVMDKALRRFGLSGRSFVHAHVAFRPRPQDDRYAHAVHELFG